MVSQGAFLAVFVSAPVNVVAGVPTEIEPCHNSPSRSSVKASVPVLRFLRSVPLSFGCGLPVFLWKASKPRAILLKVLSQ